jgi:hypothetical protein
MQMWMDGPPLHIDRSSHLPCAVSAVVVNVNGKVNKLKLIKWMGYGRAGFALFVSACSKFCKENRKSLFHTPSPSSGVSSSHGQRT